jgi:hypothetical protein
MIWGFSKDLHIGMKRFDGYPPDAIASNLISLLEELRAALSAMQRPSGEQPVER